MYVPEIFKQGSMVMKDYESIGFIKLPRKIPLHKIFNVKREYSKFEAFIDMFFKASFKEHSIIVNEKELQLKRGDLFTTTETLAKSWDWTQNKVFRFLEDLQNFKMILKKKCNYNGTLIKIIDYDEIQKCTASEDSLDNRKPNQKQNREANRMPNSMENEVVPDTNRIQNRMDDSEQNKKLLSIYSNKDIKKEKKKESSSTSENSIFIFPSMEEVKQYLSELNRFDEKTINSISKKYYKIRSSTNWIKKNRSPVTDFKEDINEWIDHDYFINNIGENHEKSRNKFSSKPQSKGFDSNEFDRILEERKAIKQTSSIES